MLGDRGDADAAPAEHRLEGDRVLALASEAGELPDQDLLEGRARLRRFVQHLGELGPVGDAARLGFVDVLASDHVAIAVGEVAQGAQLGGDGEVDVLAVRGDSGVEGGWDRGLWLLHGRLLSRLRCAAFHVRNIVACFPPFCSYRPPPSAREFKTAVTMKSR
ncbi:MAG: hypothetical protein OXH40_04575 [Chloroflexi bacterium]|nr:hypothetical protein [Chloroflexota bacterium]